MSFPIHTCYQSGWDTLSGARICRVHGVQNHPSCAVVQGLVDPRASPTFTTFTTYTHHSPTVTISPFHGSSPLPSPRHGFSPLPSPLHVSSPLTSATLSPLHVVSPLSPAFAVVNLQNTHSPSSPVIPALLLTTPSVNPLVALGSDSRNHKVQCDISNDPINARVYNSCGRSASLTPEQKGSPVIEGALHSRFCVMFDHPGLADTIDFHGSPTVGDLLTELHSHFHERVGSGEKSHLKQLGLYQSAITAQTKRCEAAFDGHAEWNRGMKRVDILGKECKFRGVYLDSSSISDHLALRVVFGK